MLLTILIDIGFIISFFIVNKFNMKCKAVLNIVLVVLFLEVFIFNFNSFRLKFKDYEKKEYKKESIMAINMDYDAEGDIYTITDGDSVFEIKDVNTKVGTIKLDMQLINTEKIPYGLWYTDATSQGYWEFPEKVFVNNIERSKYVTCYLSGNTSYLAILLKGEEGTKIKIDSISINSDVPFYFSIVRVLALVTIILLVYKMLTSQVFNMPYIAKNIKQTIILCIVITFFIYIVVQISITTETGNLEYDYLTDAIISGKVALGIKPVEEFLSLDNPYDPIQRENIDYMWDVAYYDNSYYVYFGVLPALLLNIPIKLLTGKYIPPNVEVAIFNALIIIILSKIVLLLYKKWFQNITFNYLILAIIGVLAGSFLFWVARRPSVYEIAMSSGICFASLGIYVMFKSIEREEISYRGLFRATTCLALSVACRPNLILVSLIFLPLLIQLFVRNIKAKRDVGNLIYSIIVPYLSIGILLMMYNYVRFGNILEFGARYQLTGNDMRNLKYRLLVVPVGIITQFFKLPLISDSFPYFYLQYSTISFFGYYPVYSFACGIFLLNPINFILFLLIGLRKKIKEKIAYNYICVFTIVALIIAMVDVAWGGSFQRYSTDYAWILNIASYLTLFIIVNNVRSEIIKSYILKFSIIITLFMLVANLGTGALVSEDNLLEQQQPETYYNIRYNICFWE